MAMNYDIQEASFNSSYGDQFIITLQFQLQRQKQKNKILQQRLRNKEIFIVQMKKMQSQIQLLSQKCREQLLQERQKRQNLQRTTLRDYLQTIAELQHKVKYLQTLQDSKKLSKFDQKLIRSKSSLKLNAQRQYLQSKYKQTHKNREEGSQVYKNFANRFLQMFQIYNNDHGEGNIKRKLKSGWKWVKQVVRQWQQNRIVLEQIFSYAQKCEQNSQKCNAEQILQFRDQIQQSNYQEEA